jgi:hypothetical protein
MACGPYLHPSHTALTTYVPESQPETYVMEIIRVLSSDFSIFSFCSSGCPTMFSKAHLASDLAHIDGCPINSAIFYSVKTTLCSEAKGWSHCLDNLVPGMRSKSNLERTIRSKATSAAHIRIVRKKLVVSMHPRYLLLVGTTKCTPQYTS